MQLGIHPASPIRYSRFRDNDRSGNESAINQFAQITQTEVNSSASGIKKEGIDYAQTTSPASSLRTPTNTGRVFGLHGNSGDRSRFDISPVERCGSAGTASRDADRCIRPATSYADQSPSPSFSALIYRAEGARARAAGLLEDENPYLWPPGAGLAWREGWLSGGVS